MIGAQETTADRAKYGRLCGDIISRKFDVKGAVYVMDNDNYKLFIKGFSCNGGGVDAIFQIKNKGLSTAELIVIPYPASSSDTQ